MIDKQVVDVIRETAREAGVRDVVVEAVLRHMLPSVRLIPQAPEAGKEHVGGCRIGGLPDLPSEVEWPRVSTARRISYREVSPAEERLSFLVQINLAEIAPFDLGGMLPKAGMLWFFFHCSESEDASSILYRESTDLSLEQRGAPIDLPTRRLFQGLDLVPHLEWTVPRPEDCGLDVADDDRSLDWWDDLEWSVFETQGFGSPNGVTPGHRLLGYPQLLQAPCLGRGDRLLLQVGSDVIGEEYPKTGMMWGDCGRIYYVISEDKLRSHQFDNWYAFFETQ